MYFQVHLLNLGSGLGQNTIQLSFCRSNCTRELIKTNSKNTLHIQFKIYNILRQSKCLLLLLRTEDTKTIKKTFKTLKSRYWITQSTPNNQRVFHNQPISFCFILKGSSCLQYFNKRTLKPNLFYGLENSFALCQFQFICYFKKHTGSLCRY